MAEVAGGDPNLAATDGGELVLDTSTITVEPRWSNTYLSYVGEEVAVIAVVFVMLPWLAFFYHQAVPSDGFRFFGLLAVAIAAIVMVGIPSVPRAAKGRVGSLRVRVWKGSVEAYASRREVIMGNPTRFPFDSITKITLLNVWKSGPPFEIRLETAGGHRISLGIRIPEQSRQLSAAFRSLVPEKCEDLPYYGRAKRRHGALGPTEGGGTQKDR